MRHCDISYAYRKANIIQNLEQGAPKCRLLRSYYIGDRNFHIEGVQNSSDVPDIVFLGHMEADSRVKSIRALVESGLRVGVPRVVWKNCGISNPNLVLLDNTQNDYNLILNKTKIALVFLSTLNEDTYTRRCFEIPATKTMMLSVYSDDISTLFEENKEIVFFRNDDELVAKAKYYMSHPEERELIANNSYLRLLKDGHSSVDRVKEIIKDFYES